MGFVRRLYYRFRFRKRNKIYKMPKKAQEKMIKLLWPDPETPMMKLTKALEKLGRP